MPNFPIIDTHMHLWDIDYLPYPWLATVPKLNRTFLLGDYDRAIERVEVEKMVFVQCECDSLNYTSETAWVTGITKIDSRVAGIVSWAPLEKGENVRKELETLIQANPLVKGIRRIIQSEEDPDFCIQPDFVRGVQILADYDLTFDICISTKHMPNVIRFAKQVPDVKMVLDHIGKPDIKGKEFDHWANGITKLSELENVYCKTSSLATEADNDRWTLSDLKPYADHVFSSFGFERCMFGGDWPVCTLAANFTTCVNTLEALIQGCSDEEKQKVFRTNAIAFYDLDNREAKNRKNEK